MMTISTKLDGMAFWEDLESGGGGASGAPTISAITVQEDGVRVVVEFSEEIAIGADETAGFVLDLSGGGITLVDGAIAGASIEFALGRTVTEEETGTADFTQPGDGVQDLEGNLLATVAGVMVVNNSTQAASDTELVTGVTLGTTVAVSGRARNENSRGRVAHHRDPTRHLRQWDALSPQA
jgi:hypothetical protein